VILKQQKETTTEPRDLSSLGGLPRIRILETTKRNYNWYNPSTPHSGEPGANGIKKQQKETTTLLERCSGLDDNECFQEIETTKRNYNWHMMLGVVTVQSAKETTKRNYNKLANEPNEYIVIPLKHWKQQKETTTCQSVS
jgi:hypothetical protein